MTEPSFTHRDDELPPSASADPPLSLEARTPGPRGLSPKIGLAALGLLILFAMVAVVLWASRNAPKGVGQHAPASAEQHL